MTVKVGSTTVCSIAAGTALPTPQPTSGDYAKIPCKDSVSGLTTARPYLHFRFGSRRAYRRPGRSTYKGLVTSDVSSHDDATAHWTS